MRKNKCAWYERMLIVEMLATGDDDAIIKADSIRFS